MRVERLKTEFDIDLTWTHFPLHPSTPEAGLTLEQLFAGRQIDIPASKARMVRLMAEEGLAYGDKQVAAGAHPYDMLEKFVVNAGAKKRRS